MKSSSQNLNLPKLIAAFLLVILSSNVFSQGEFMHKGQSGLQFDGFYLQSKKTMYIESDQGIVNTKDATQSGFGGRIGISIKGVFDMQYSFNGWTLPSSSLYPETKGRTINARAVIHFAKQSDKLPFSIRGLIAYGYSDYDGIGTNDTDVDFGLGISRRTYFRDNFSIVPTIDFLYSISNYTMDTADDIELTGGIISLSIPIAYNLARNHLIHFAPVINYGMNETEGSMGFNLGYIIPLYRK